MLLHFKNLYPQLTPYWNKYLEFQVRREVPAKTLLLEEGKISQQYISIDKGCVRAFFNNNGTDKTVQFFFENEGLASLESFLNDTPSQISIETLEPSVVYQLSKKHVTELMTELSHQPEMMPVLLKIAAGRQMHYINEFVSFIRDTPEQRYQNLLTTRPHIIQRIPQHYIASYLGISTVHLSRIKSKMAKGQSHF